jgi:hydroxymethylpyrimidine/phosphomethylpyrimidine kinase
MSGTTTTPVAALTIAGSDSGGGAGIQADLKTFAALGVHGASALTALTAQNTRGVSAVHAPPPAFVAEQIAAVLGDFDIRAIKTGMLYSADIIAAVADALAGRDTIPLVLDPVMIAASGDPLIQPDAVAMVVERLFPRAAIITPNLAEAAHLTGEPAATSLAAMERQAVLLRQRGARAVLVKGGHGEGDEAIDLLLDEAGVATFAAPRIMTRNIHGTGCTLSAAIAARLAHGDGLRAAVRFAKAWLAEAILAAKDQRLGAGSGPVHHFHALWPPVDEALAGEASAGEARP